MALPGTPLANHPCVANPRRELVSDKTLTRASARPVCDEWGLYDPEQAGFEAIVRLLPNEDHERAVASSLPRNNTTSVRQS